MKGFQEPALRPRAVASSERRRYFLLPRPSNALVWYVFRRQTEGIMSGEYIIARENFKEAEKHVSAETDPVMFNLIYGLQSLTEQIALDFAALHGAVAERGA